MSAMSEVADMSATEALRAKLRGALLRPSDDGYAQASRAWNLRAEQRPALVIVAEDATDVGAAVRFARGTGMGVGVMATGHGVGALCDGGLLLNT